MRYIFCLLFFIGFCHTAIAQNELPTLVSNLESADNDSVRTERYRSLFQYYQYVNPDSAKYYLEEGVSYFKDKNYKRGVIVLTNALGVLESMQGKQEVAKVRFREVLKYYEEIGDKRGIAVANNGLGVAEGRTGNYLG